MVLDAKLAENISKTEPCYWYIFFAYAEWKQMFLMFDFNIFISETNFQKYHNRNILIFVKLYISGVIFTFFCT